MRFNQTDMLYEENGNKNTYKRVLCLKAYQHLYVI